ncbi:MBL fold metallo-hydrolase [Candidatus Bathyarchaeota archaeon]|nr:MBL fold metallo-hydrolase [Candidatus Bathyarchaeota archaeon]
MFFQQVKGAGDNFSYLIADKESKETMVVDPSNNGLELIEVIESEGLKLIYIVDTHAHRDHTNGNAILKSKYQAKVVVYSGSSVTKDIEVMDGDVLRVGQVKVSVLHTPGHSPDSISLLVDGKVLTGDTLFVGECGRTDLSGGDSRQMYQSLFEVLMKLPDNLEVYPGHDYGIKPSSTIGRERKTNYVLQPRSIQEFVEFMHTP